MLDDPGHVLLAVGAIDDHEEFLLADAVDDDVIHDAAARIGQERVAGSPLSHLGEIAHDELVERLE